MQNSRYESFAKKFEIEAFFHRPTIWKPGWLQNALSCLANYLNPLTPGIQGTLSVYSVSSAKFLMYKKERKTDSSPIMRHRYAKSTIGRFCPASSRCKDSSLHEDMKYLCSSNPFFSLCIMKHQYSFYFYMMFFAWTTIPPNKFQSKPGNSYFLGPIDEANRFFYFLYIHGGHEDILHLSCTQERLLE